MGLNKDIDKGHSVGNIRSLDANSNIILINTEKDYNIVDEYFFEPSSDAAVNKFIKDVERLVRQSDEYKKYIKYLTNTHELTNDVLMANIDTNMAALEFHHYPFTLYDIVDIMLEYYMYNKHKVTSINLAEKVLVEHYENRIGLARLTVTNHELAHEGALFVPLSAVFGDVNAFIDKYYDFISDELMIKYNKLIDIENTKNYDNTRIFNKKKNDELG